MTENEWLACADPKLMMEFLRGKARDRKLWLLSCELSRQVDEYRIERPADSRHVMWEMASTLLAELARSNHQSLCEMLRDLFGPTPFRSVSMAPPWYASSVVSQAQFIYDDRRFSDLPVLADELVRAGCTNNDILAHCREPGNHWRGCWVVDLLLGKN